MKKPLHLGTLVALLVLALAASGDRVRYTGGTFKTAREAQDEPEGTPTWTNDPVFKRDVFTFARIEYSIGDYGQGSSGPMRWSADFPDSDLNFSWRLQQVSSLRVDPDGRVVKLTDKDLLDHPFIYIVEPGRLTFSQEEVGVLQRYLLNGGFLMFDDFWGEWEWGNFEKEIKKVFKDRPIEDLQLDHPIFHSVVDLREKPQVPGLPHFEKGRTYERRDGQEVHYRGIFDDKRRLMVVICHNTDLGDGWEREGANEDYFHAFSEKKAYPMGINILVYAMTH
jgi:uncharacterized protein DUF4159